ncbi:hypothetical protein BaRGS_00021047 [Batillaria attramentaria]|uniref:Uncharacterized protein n=1 Tax=Batillaria attramentaria TaxID=370345 RepID=A0ABD0KLR9_9CAEN
MRDSVFENALKNVANALKSAEMPPKSVEMPPKSIENAPKSVKIKRVKNKYSDGPLDVADLEPLTHNIIKLAPPPSSQGGGPPASFCALCSLISYPHHGV